MTDAGTSPPKKSFIFYHGGRSSTIKFYPGTLPNDILALAKAKLGIAQHLEVSVRDESDDPLVFDPVNIPENAKLFLGVDGAGYMPYLETYVREDDW